MGSPALLLGRLRRWLLVPPAVPLFGHRRHVPAPSAVTHHAPVTRPAPEYRAQRAEDEEQEEQRDDQPEETEVAERPPVIRISRPARRGLDQLPAQGQSLRH